MRMNRDVHTDMQAHKCILLMASEPLHALVTASYAEPQPKVIRIPNEDAMYFKGIINLLYGKQVDLADYDSGFPLCAHKWKLYGFFDAYFEVLGNRTDICYVEKFRICRPIMSKVKLPLSIRKFLSRAFGQHVNEFERELGYKNVWGYKWDTVSNVAGSSSSFLNQEKRKSNIWQMFIFQGMLLDVFKNFGLFRHMKMKKCGNEFGHICRFDRDFRMISVAYILHELRCDISERTRRSIISYVGYLDLLEALSHGDEIEQGDVTSPRCHTDSYMRV